MQGEWEGTTWSMLEPHVVHWVRWEVKVESFLIVMGLICLSLKVEAQLDVKTIDCCVILFYYELFAF